MKRISAALFTTILIAGCGESGHSDSSGGEMLHESIPSRELTDRLREETAYSYTCSVGDVSVSTFRSGASYYRSETGDGEGLEILTVDGVSYARYTGETTDDSQERDAVKKKLNGAWGTWGQPDTIALEELPYGAASCMEWASIDIEDVDKAHNHMGKTYFEVVSGGDKATGAVVEDEDGRETVVITGPDGVLLEMTLRETDRSSIAQDIDNTEPTAPENSVTLTQEEYFALVGG